MRDNTSGSDRPVLKNQEVEISPQAMRVGRDIFRAWFCEMAQYGFFEGMPTTEMLDAYIAKSYSAMRGAQPRS